MTRPAAANANGTINSVKPVKSVGGWMTIHGFCSRSFRPCPSAGTKPGTCSIGASGNLSASVANVLTPMGSGPSLSPTTIDSRNAWHSATTAITMGANKTCASRAAPVRPGRVHHRIRRPPVAAVIIAQSMNEPSCPAQNDENV